MTHASLLLQTLQERGYIHQITDPNGLDALANQQVLPGYIGFDATAPSLHVGSLVQIMMLRHLQRSGHKPIVVMGGGTTKVGDPSGKDESRRILSDGDIAANIASIRRVFERFLTFGEGPTDAIIINNADWLDTLEYVPFLRDVGRHFTINRMLTFDSVKLRLEREQPLTFLEFNYMILQAYDFLELSRRVGCRLQMGGSDQWGNIVNGIELTRRTDSIQLFGLTTPLITTSDGSKMGKTAAGAVWLNHDALRPYDYWTFWRNTQDGDIGRFLRLFTDLPLCEIARLESLQGEELNDAKKILADAATALAHGDAVRGDDLPRHAIASEVITIVDALIALEFVTSKGEARRLIAGGGARIDGEKVTDEAALIAPGADPVKVSAGKKLHGLVVR